MAYFLDPKLAALCEPKPRVLPNKFAKLCDRGCGSKVPAGEGSLEKVGRAWKVYHLAC